MSAIKSLCFKVEPALPSWNEVYKSPHWTVRHRLQQIWKDMVAANLKAHLNFNRIRFDKVLFEVPVKMTVINYASRPIDSANIYTKCLDALEGIVIKDDGYKHVISTEGITRKISNPLSFSSILVEPISAETAENDRLAIARQVVATQAEDEGLWFVAQTTGEAYLQQELRRLHAVIEGKEGDANENQCNQAL